MFDASESHHAIVGQSVVAKVREIWRISPIRVALRRIRKRFNPCGSLGSSRNQDRVYVSCVSARTTANIVTFDNGHSIARGMLIFELRR